MSLNTDQAHTELSPGLQFTAQFVSQYHQFITFSDLLKLGVRETTAKLLLMPKIVIFYCEPISLSSLSAWKLTTIKEKDSFHQSYLSQRRIISRTGKYPNKGWCVSGGDVFSCDWSVL